jgi:Response regulator containing a CheY-like receiver domain and an HTH DNA-binding domain
MKIVIADDSALWRDRIKSSFNGSYDISIVGEADNGNEALRLIRETEPDLAILDIRMPEMNGMEVLKNIKEMKMKVKVCMLTNYAYPQYKKKCIEAGADYFLSKTEDFEEIETIVSDMLGDEVQNNNK